MSHNKHTSRPALNGITRAAEDEPASKKDGSDYVDPFCGKPDDNWRALRNRTLDIGRAYRQSPVPKLINTYRSFVSVAVARLGSSAKRAVGQYGQSFLSHLDQISTTRRRRVSLAGRHQCRLGQNYIPTPRCCCSGAFVLRKVSLRCVREGQ